LHIFWLPYGVNNHNNNPAVLAIVDASKKYYGFPETFNFPSFGTLVPLKQEAVQIEL